MEIAERPDTAKPIIAHPQSKIHSTASQSKGDSADMIAFAIELPMTAIALLHAKRCDRRENRSIHHNLIISTTVLNLSYDP
jgi:hypothetical protein